MNISEIWQLNPTETNPYPAIKWVTVHGKPYYMTNGLGVRADHYNIVAIWRVKKINWLAQLTRWIKKIL